MGARLGRMAGIVSTKKPRVVVVAGTTAVGKTDLSLELARRLDGEVISADSVQVYCGLNVGSAKIDVSSCPDVPHHLLDVVKVTQPFSVREFHELAISATEAILSRDHLPLIVGGTGLYIQTLLQGLTGAPPSTPESRERVEALLKEDEGDWEKSLQRLRSIDDEYANSLDKNDWYRLIRALDICLQSGRTVTSYKKNHDTTNSPYNFKCLFLTMPRFLLFQRIDLRCELIIEQGLFQEVILLVSQYGLIADSTAGRSVGYRQALEWLQDTWGFPDQNRTTPYTIKIPPEKLNESFQTFLRNYKAKTRLLAQNQLTWHRKGDRFQWVNMAPGDQKLEMKEVAERVSQWLENETPLPPEWDGKPLMKLTKEELQLLKTYSPKHDAPQIFSDEKKVERLVNEIESALQRTLSPHQQNV